MKSISQNALKLFTIIVLFIFTLSSASFSSLVKADGIAAANSSFARGADIGWLQQMEDSGIKFYNDNGEQQDCLQILKDHGINAIRLRVWVNPKDGYCDKNHTIAMAERAYSMGFKIMIDFHYSDYWADPGKQNSPEAWKKYNLDQLKDAVYNHTYDVLNSLKKSGVTVSWVQIGNEINNGMLWDNLGKGLSSSADSFKNMVEVINSGYSAVKDVDENTKVILHLDDGSNNSKYVWWFNNATTCGVKYDVIGMSFYPEVSNWKNSADLIGENLKDVAARYGKEVMVCEVGMDWEYPSETKQMLEYLQDKVRDVPNGKGLGVFYWEPEGIQKWSNYSKVAFDNSGKPTEAMDAFLYKLDADTKDTTSTANANDESSKTNPKLSSEQIKAILTICVKLQFIKSLIKFF